MTASTADQQSVAQPAAQPARPPATGLDPRLRTAIALVAVVAGGLVVGAVTSPAQQYAPEWVVGIANSSSGWTLAAFALVRLSRLRVLAAACAGPAAFSAMLVGYNVVSELRGYPNGSLFADLFFWAGMAVGPVVGASAALLRDGRPVLRALAIAPLPAVLIGEGAFGLTVVAGSTSPFFWWGVILLGVAFTTWRLVRQRPGRRLTASVLALVLAGAALFWLVYQQPLALLL